MRRLLVPTDFSELSLVGLEYASLMAKLYDDKIFILYVIDKLTLSSFPAIEGISESKLKEVEQKSIEQLHNLAKHYAPHCEDLTVVVRRGVPYLEIVKFAQKECIDVIVIATHGRTGISHVLMGSVAEKVVRYSSVPVLTVKPAKMQVKFVDQADIDEQLHLKL